MGRLACTVGLLLAVTATAVPALARRVLGTLVDQTGLPVPGATVRLLDVRPLWRD